MKNRFAVCFAAFALCLGLLAGCGCMRTDTPVQDNNPGMTDNNGTNGNVDPNLNGSIDNGTMDDGNDNVNDATDADPNDDVVGGAVDEGLEAGEDALNNAADDLVGNNENAKARN